MATTKTKKVTKKVTPTIEDKILNNAKEETITKEVYDVFNANTAYKVTNLQINNKPSYMAGTMVKQFFGSTNYEAKEKLETGAKEVILYETNSSGDKIELYKIEVV